MKTSPPKRPKVGLRERKKAKTRTAIQEHALRLFREQGYTNTTIEQITEAAEVSPSTFFRYFATKEDVVMYDALDPVIIEAFKTQPADLTPIQAFRNAMRAAFGQLSAKEMEQLRERATLMLAVPELRARMLDDFVQSAQVFASLIGKRVGRPADAFAVRTFIGAVIGVAVSVWLAAAGDPTADYIAQMDAALAQLESGLPL